MLSRVCYSSSKKELALGIISTLSFLLSFLLSLFYPLNGEYGEISYSFTVILLVISILLCTYLAFKNKTKIPVKITLFFLFLVFSALIIVSATTQNPVGSSSSSYFENFQIASLFSGPYGVLLLILLFALNLEEYPIDELEIKSSTICKRSVFYLFSISRSVLFCLFLSFCSYPAFFPDGPYFLDSFLFSIYASIALIFIGIALFLASLQNSHSWHLPFISVFLFIDIFILSIPNWQFGESSSFDPAFSYIYMICSLLVFFLVNIGMQSLFNLSYNHTHDFIPSLSHRTSSYLNLFASLFFLSVSFEWPFLLQGQRLHPAIMGSCLTLGLLLLFLSAFFMERGRRKAKDYSLPFS